MQSVSHQTIGTFSLVFLLLSAADISLQFQHSFSAHWGLEVGKSV